MFQAYGLYSHISANRLRTVFLLAGFVVLLVALMFSVSLIFEALSADAPLEVLLARALADVKQGWPVALGGAAALVLHRLLLSSVDDRLCDRLRGRVAQGGAAAL